MSCLRHKDLYILNIYIILIYNIDSSRQIQGGIIKNKRYKYVRPTVRDGANRPAHNYIFDLSVFKNIAVCELNMDNLENIICVRNYFNELAKKHLGA